MGKYTNRVARKIMEEYVGRKLRFFEHVHHIDENPFNNNISNLKIVSPEEHSTIHRHARGKKHKKPSWNKLSEEKVLNILLLHGKGLSYAEISRLTGVSGMTARRYIKNAI